MRRIDGQHAKCPRPVVIEVCQSQEPALGRPPIRAWKLQCHGTGLSEIRAAPDCGPCELARFHGRAQAPGPRPGIEAARLHSPGLPAVVRDVPGDERTVIVEDLQRGGSTRRVARRGWPVVHLMGPARIQCLPRRAAIGGSQQGRCRGAGFLHVECAINGPSVQQAGKGNLDQLGGRRRSIDPAPVRAAIGALPDRCFAEAA